MRITQIQALRALAAILVTVFHAHLVPGGFIGVDIFYVISGYLITGLIVREIEKNGRLDFIAFYQRRIKRLLPTSFFILIVTALVSWLVLPPIARSNLGRDIAGAALYISNYLFAFWQNDYQNLNATPSPVIHYWSLAVEEQFYLFWPVIIALLAKGGVRLIRNGILVITAGSLLLSIIYTQTHPIWSFYSLPTRAWELGIGALLIFLPKDLLSKKYFAILGVLGITASSLIFSNDSPFPGYRALLPVIATALALGSVSAWPRGLNAVGNHSVTQWLGKISYPLYLWHWPALVLPATVLGRGLYIYESVLCILLTIILADVTHRFIEEPLRHKTFSSKRTFRLAVTSTVATCLLGLAIFSTSSTAISIEGVRGGATTLAQITRKPITSADGCHLSHSEIKIGECSYGNLTSKKTIVLFGDSHAAQWFPALRAIAEAQNLKLISLTKSSCAAFDLPRANEGSYIDSICKAWRVSATKRILVENPVAVIMSSLEYYRPASEKVSINSWWLSAQKTTLKSLSKSQASLVVIRDTPHPTQDIPNCLSLRSPIKCQTRPKVPLPILESFKIIDPTQWLCQSSCPAIINGTITYRDNSHLSVDMSKSLAPQLLASLESLKALESQ